MRMTRQSGMGLVELMVWAAVSMLIIGIIGIIYVNSKQLTRVNDTISRLQENGRFAIYLIDRDIRMAGFRGCNGFDVAPASTLASAAYPYQFDVAIAGYHGNGSSWTPALDPSVSTLDPAPSTSADVVTIRQIYGQGVQLTAPMAGTTGTLQVAAGSPLAVGDILLAADCAAAAIFNVTSFDAATGVVGHATGGGATPGNSTNDLGHVFSTDAAVYRLVTQTYYVAASARKPGTNALWTNAVPAYDGQPQPEEMVEGVDAVALYFGEATDGNHAANRYVTADGVGTWGNVVSVKAQVLLASVLDNMTTSPQPYAFPDTAASVTTPSDRRMRSVLSSVVTLRNRVP
jgi:type IV pilus assembly protein PilW